MNPKPAYQNFFLHPEIPRRRQYEIVRARFVDRLPVKEIARRFGVRFNTAQALIRDFKHALDHNSLPEFFLAPSPGPKGERIKSQVREPILALRARGYASTDIHSALALANRKVSLSLIDQVLKEKGWSGLRKRTREERERIADEIRSGKIPGLTVPVPATPETPPVADRKQLDLSAGRSWFTRQAGLFLFLPFLRQIGIESLVQRVRLAGSQMIPALSYLLSLLSLKLLDKERKSHVADWSFDEAIGLFAGLNAPPKTTALTDYSYRLEEGQQNALLAEWVGAVAMPLS